MPGTEAGTTTITNGELFRAVELIRGDIGILRGEIKERPTANDLKYLEQRVSDLENWQTWALRLGGPSLVACLVAAGANLAARV